MKDNPSTIGKSYWKCKNCGAKSPVDSIHCVKCKRELLIYGEMVFPPTPPLAEPSLQNPQNSGKTPSPHKPIFGRSKIEKPPSFRTWKAMPQARSFHGIVYALAWIAAVVLLFFSVDGLDTSSSSYAVVKFSAARLALSAATMAVLISFRFVSRRVQSAASTDRSGEAGKLLMICLFRTGSAILVCLLSYVTCLLHYGDITIAYDGLHTSLEVSVWYSDLIGWMTGVAAGLFAGLIPLLVGRARMSGNKRTVSFLLCLFAGSIGSLIHIAASFVLVGIVCAMYCVFAFGRRGDKEDR